MLMLEKWWSWAWLLWVVLPTTCGYTIAERNGDDEKNNIVIEILDLAQQDRLLNHNDRSE
jgi:hypothetical protein